MRLLNNKNSKDYQCPFQDEEKIDEQREDGSFQQTNFLLEQQLKFSIRAQLELITTSSRLKKHLANIQTRINLVEQETSKAIQKLKMLKKKKKNQE